MQTFDKADGTPAESRLTDVLLRIYAAGAVAFFAMAAIYNWRADPARITLLMVAISESITIALIIFSRRARQRDWRPLSVTASFIAMFYMLAFSLEPGRHFIPESVGVTLQVTGIILQLYAKLSLGRAFGILPASRHLVTRGAYRWLRHPIYFSYLVGHTGFLLTNFSLQNLAVLVVLYSAQLLRIEREEQMLMSFPGYQEYRDRVRYKLIPMVY